MKNDNIIISERPRSFWQIPLASLFFTAAIGLLVFTLYKMHWRDNELINFGHTLSDVFYLVAIGVTFCFQKSVYVDLKNSKFRSTFEIGPIKIGQWKTITDYEYVSVFHQPLKNGGKTFEVNLWYDKNKHWELYRKNSSVDAFLIAHDLSEQLKIDLLDATIPNDYKWIDKHATKKFGKIIYKD